MTKQDNDTVLWCELDCLINKDKQGIELDPKYSDSISFVCSWYPKINQAKKLIPVMLNELKNDNWKKCKIRSLFDTESNTNRQHSLASSSYKKLKKTFKNKSVSLATKLRVFNGYVGTIFFV